MRVAILDAWSGVAGDMWVGAMLDAGAPMQALIDVVRSLQLPGVSIRDDTVMRASLRGTHFCVDVGGAVAGQFTMLSDRAHATVQLPNHDAHVHRRLGDIERIVGKADLPEVVRDQCIEVYRAIAVVEAEAHGTTVDDVHFHEVGAEDTIVDVVCACLATHLLGIERLYANGIAVGSGTVRAAHGILPVPAPATAALLRGIPVRTGGLKGERTTPTGAALLRTLVHAFDQPVSITTEAIGYGAGTRDDPDVPNLLRVMVGELVEATSPTDLCELQCQLDTATGEQVGWLLDALLQRGAVDAFAAPVTMKKGRPGLLITVLCDEARRAIITDLLLEESTSLGVRHHRVSRRVLERWQETRATSMGEVVFKVARLPSGQVVARPEDDELQRLTKAHDLGRAEVLRRLLEKNA
ncbi:MAG: hypothetical protein ACI8UD_003054 [Planctomycetota bacterium]|jgi:uncharacterized protein (TIGR00299 family) protein